MAIGWCIYLCCFRYFFSRTIFIGSEFITVLKLAFTSSIQWDAVHNHWSSSENFKSVVAHMAFVTVVSKKKFLAFVSFLFVSLKKCQAHWQKIRMYGPFVFQPAVTFGGRQNYKILTSTLYFFVLYLSRRNGLLCIINWAEFFPTLAKLVDTIVRESMFLSSGSWIWLVLLFSVLKTWFVLTLLSVCRLAVLPVSSGFAKTAHPSLAASEKLHNRINVTSHRIYYAKLKMQLFFPFKSTHFDSLAMAAEKYSNKNFLGLYC